MHTNTQHSQASLVLKDGHSHLAAWLHTFDQRPTIGESVEIPARFQPDPAGYGQRAVVSRIELRDRLPDLVELEANCLVKRQDRPVIVLNADRIRESLHGAAEAHLRATLKFPLIVWESSTQPDPVVRFHDPATDRKSCPPSVRSGLLDLLYQPVTVCSHDE